jgi:hypothetical protein
VTTESSAGRIESNVGRIESSVGIIESSVDVSGSIRASLYICLIRLQQMRMEMHEGFSRVENIVCMEGMTGRQALTQVRQSYSLAMLST